jgi:hypothetical protein
MRPRLLVAFFAAFAFVAVLFGVRVRSASAAELDASDATTTTTQSQVGKQLARPGSYAAAYGAPLCDDRAASTYAAEPTPAPTDDGLAVTPRAEADACRDVQRLRADDAGAPQQDDLNRSTPIARAVAVVPSAELELPVAVAEVVAFERPSGDEAREGFLERDNPPPRPIPWRA